MALLAAPQAAAAAIPASLAPPAPFPLIATQSFDHEFVAPGITRGSYHLQTSNGPLVISFVTIDPHNPMVHLGTVLSHDRIISSGETASSMAARTGAVAGINADYFDIGNTNTPLGILIENGGLVRTPSSRVALTVTRDRTVHFAPFHFSGVAHDGNQTLPIATVNEWPPVAAGATLLTPMFGVPSAAPSSTFVAEMVPSPIDGEPDTSAPNGRYRITQIDQGAPPGQPGFALAFKTTPPGIAPDVGDLIDIGVDTDPPLANIVAAAGGGPLLLASGAAVDDPASPGYATRDLRIPVAAAATLADGTLVLIVVDGRRPAISVGVNRAELIALLRGLGATDAMQFDSGGSATLVARVLGEGRPSVQNDPSDGAERPVADGFFAYSDAPVGPPARLVVRPATIVALPGVEIPLNAVITDAAGHPLGAAHGPWHLAGDARVDDDGVLHVGSTLGASLLTFERDGVRAEVPLEIVSAPARIAIEPERPDPDPFERITLHALAFDARGRRIDTGDDVRWSALRGHIDAAGAYTAGAADGFVTAAVGTVASSEIVHVGRHRKVLALFDEAHRAQWRFTTIPPDGPGTLAFLGVATLQLSYDFSSGERAAYANAPVPLGEPLSLSCAIDGDGNGAGLRVALIDRYGERTHAQHIGRDGRHSRLRGRGTGNRATRAVEVGMVFGSHAARALDTAQQSGAEYCEIRFERGRSERIEVRNGDVRTLNDDRSDGYGIRALVGGAWGFAASSGMSDAEIDATAARAVAIAKAGAGAARLRTGEPPTDAPVATFATHVVRDPQTVPLGERVALLLEAERALHATSSIVTARAWLDLWRTEKHFFSTAGAHIVQTIVQSGSGMSALAVGNGDAQMRMWPGDRGLYQSGGWEIIEAAQLRENAQRIGEEAHQLLSAPQCPSGTMDLVLGGSQVSLQIHESCGHAAELDRIMGWEANFSGTSFLDPAALGTLRYGSDLVTIEIDNTLAQGLATAAYDDEGTRSIRSDIIRNGMLAGFETSRDTARLIGRTSNACVRASGWQHVPMIRMCNLNLLPGTTPFEHLFDDVKQGIYMEANRSWSIDDRRLNFQFGTQIGWEIVNGKRGRMVKNPTYGGVTPQFWGSCDAIGDADSWFAWGTPNCGKGEPMQVGRTTQAASPARFRNVAVGVGYDG